jgi:hypothetical protein
MSCAVRGSSGYFAGVWHQYRGPEQGSISFFFQLALPAVAD